jgi:hypothetical protein
VKSALWRHLPRSTFTRSRPFPRLSFLSYQLPVFGAGTLLSH